MPPIMGESSGRVLRTDGTAVNVADILTAVYDAVNGVIKTTGGGGSAGGGGGGLSTVTKTLWEAFDYEDVDGNYRPNPSEWDITFTGGASYAPPFGGISVSMPITPGASFQMLSKQTFTRYVSLRFECNFPQAAGRAIKVTLVAVDAQGNPTTDAYGSEYELGFLFDTSYGLQNPNYTSGVPVTPASGLGGVWNGNFVVEYSGVDLYLSSPSDHGTVVIHPPATNSYKVRVTIVNQDAPGTTPASTADDYTFIVIGARQFSEPPADLVSRPTVVIQADPWHVITDAPIAVTQTTPWHVINDNFSTDVTQSQSGPPWVTSVRGTDGTSQAWNALHVLADGSIQVKVLGVGLNSNNWVWVADTVSRNSDFLSPVQTNEFGRGMHLVVQVLTMPPTGQIAINIEAEQPSTTRYALLNGSGITSNGVFVFRIYPGLTPVNNFTVNDVLPKTWRLRVMHLNTVDIIYTAYACYIL